MIMTTKEFIRRSDYFNSLDSACIALFNSDFCWKITQLSGNISSVFYSNDAVDFIKDHPAFFSYTNAVYFEIYSRSQFDTECKYFKSFLCRLSKYQFDCFKASGKCSHLLAFVLQNNNSIV